MSARRSYVRPSEGKAMDFSRRSSLKAMAALATTASFARVALAKTVDPLSGAFLYEKVRAYDSLGEHRTATPGDEATSRWLSDELVRAGFRAEKQIVPTDLFVPGECSLEVAGAKIPAFPAWPPHPEDGVTAPLVNADASDVSGRIVVFDMQHPGATWALPGERDVVEPLIARGARAVVVCTEGPTGEVIAQNAEPLGRTWNAPVVLVGGKYASALLQAAASGVSATLVSRGHFTPQAPATNVVATRPGKGKAVVISTPKSGWFHCAGERGSGIAIFLALAHKLAHETDASLVFVANTGHEIGQTGAKLFAKTRAPRPADTKLWFHLGADVATRKIVVENGALRGLDEMSDTHRIFATPRLMAAARTAFAGQPGYGDPLPTDPVKTPGELHDFLAEGYADIAGMLGPSPVFHTPLDRTEIATTPAVLEAVARCTHAFLRSVL